MTKSKKIGRPLLIRKIVKKASLPPSKKSSGYFTRDQLVELSLYLDNVGTISEEVEKLDITVKGDNTNDAERTDKKV